MKLLGDDDDGNAVLFVEIEERHQDHPLGTADSERLCPEIAQFLQMNSDGVDYPGEPPDGFLVFGSRIDQINIPSHIQNLYLPVVSRDLS
jgi:hypothetical protein